MIFLKFFLKPLLRAYSLALGKEIFRIFKKKSLPRAIARALGKGPFFAEGLGHCPRQRDRNLIFFCFLHSIDTSISYIYIYISQRTHFLTIYHNHNCEPQITIYYNDKSHVHHHSHVYYDKLMKSKHKSQP